VDAETAGHPAKLKKTPYQFIKFPKIFFLELLCVDVKNAVLSLGKENLQYN
jgi:hypothetical protein